MDIIQQLLKLIKINTRISSLHSSDEILKEIMNEAMSLTGTSAAFVLRVEANRALACFARYDTGAIEAGTAWSSSSALEAHDAQRMVYSTRALESGNAAPSIVMGSIQTLISAPLSSDPSGTVVLQLVGRDTTSIDPQTISLLNLFVGQVQVTTAKTKLEDAAVRNAALAATGELAAQVAHDIRAPLAALEAAAQEIARLPEEQGALIRGAVGRIRGIADDLLDKNRAAGAKPSPSAHPLAELVEALTAEKRLQYRSRVAIESMLESGIVVRVEPGEFKRLLSNLVDNAVEAMGGSGAIRVSLSTLDGRARLSVRDDGRGIPAEILARLGQRGETHGKTGGSGLGLYHARTSAESWGGSLEIVSELGRGTTVTVSLPLALPPARERCDAVLIDDDALVRMTWAMAAERAGKNLRAFSSAADFYAEAGGLDRATPVYLDSDLGDGVKGEVESARVHALGFGEIYLATGHPPEKFAKIAHLRGVIGKTPPWDQRAG